MVFKTLMFWDYDLYEKLLEEERQHALSEDRRAHTLSQVMSHMSASQKGDDKIRAKSGNQDPNWDSKSQGLPEEAQKESLLEPGKEDIIETS